MSRNPNEVELLKRRANEVKREFEDEINCIMQGMGDMDKTLEDKRSDTKITDKDDLKEYEGRLENLKEELKTLKKIKKHQKKISKLEDERSDVIKEIERKKNSHKKH